ncbi:MAG: hypothetical protein GVY30_00835 [Chloroflexi bacterium]|nr:hypothetical protein [Chloroflexota bacterium]
MTSKIKMNVVSVSVLLAMVLSFVPGAAIAAEPQPVPSPPNEPKLIVITNTAIHQAPGTPTVTAVVPGPGNQSAIQTAILAYYISGDGKEHVQAGSKLELFGFPTSGETLAFIWNTTSGGMYGTPYCRTTWGSSCERRTAFYEGEGDTWDAYSVANIYWGESSIIENSVMTSQSF